METNDNPAYRELLLEEGRLKLRQWAFGRCLYRAWQKNGDEKYDYSSDPKAVAQAARNLAAAATPRDREETLASFKKAWWIFHLYFTPREIYEIDETYVALMGNVREAMKRGNTIPFLLPEIYEISGKAGAELAQVIKFPEKTVEKDD
jgi:hypothetical protein